MLDALDSGDVVLVIRARTSEGRTRAKAQGKSLGRPFKLTEHQKAEAIRRRESDEEIRAPTRYDQLDALCAAFGFRTFTQPDHRELSAWLVPIALATVSAIMVAEALMAELRRRRITVGNSVMQPLS